MRARTGFLLPLAALTLTGCLASGVVQTAETAGKDSFQFAFEPGVFGATGGGAVSALPSINVSARYGVSDRFDIGGRFGTKLIEVQGKYMFTEPSPDDVQVAIAPHVGGLAIGGGGARAGIAWVKVPLLVDIPVGQSDVVLGPSTQVATVFGGDDSGSGGAAILFVGTSVGYAARVGERSRILPEFAIEYPVVGGGSVNGEGAVGSIGGGALFSFQVGILLGGRERVPNP